MTVHPLLLGFGFRHGQTMHGFLGLLLGQPKLFNGKGGNAVGVLAAKPFGYGDQLALLAPAGNCIFRFAEYPGGLPNRETLAGKAVKSGLGGCGSFAEVGGVVQNGNPLSLRAFYRSYRQGI
jgi:hypothetical protein